MAVITSGGETIVRYSRWLIATYYWIAIGAGILGAMCLLGALGEAIESGSLAHKGWGIMSWLLTGLMLGVMAMQMYTFARAYGQTFVAMGPDGMRMKLPRSDGDLLAVGAERRFQWKDISGISYEHSMRKRVCKFTAGEYVYTLTQNNCPSPRKVAQMMADRKGVPSAASGATA